MRYLRWFALLLFALAIAYGIWADRQYSKDKNMDFPMITAEQPVLELSVSDGEDGLLQGLTAYDLTDGDLTNRIMVASTSHMTNGKVKVKYVVFDSHNNSSTFTRDVVYTDYHTPRFFLHMPPVYELGSNVDFLTYLTVIDPLEGDISERIKVVTSQVSNYMEGKFPVALEVTNSFGVTERLQLWISVVKKNSSSVNITLDGYVTYYEPDAEFDPYSLIVGVKHRDGTSLDASKVQVLGGVDPTKAGFYELTYRYDDGTNVGETYLTVVVTEEVAAE